MVIRYFFAPSICGLLKVTLELRFFDSLSTLLVGLTVLSTFVALLSYDFQLGRFPQYFCLLGWIAFFMIVAFWTRNILVFYCAFEAVLIPTFMFMGLFGASSAKTQASFRLFIFTVAGSAFFLAGLALVWAWVGSFNYYAVLDFLWLRPDLQPVLALLFSIALLFKLPAFPVYLWLTSAHVEAPTAGSMILASLMLKLGVYGLIRFVVQLCPDGALFWSPWFIALGCVGFTLAAGLAYVVTDAKRAIAYTSVGHMNLLLAGLFSLNVAGYTSAVVTTVTHAFVSLATFYLIGCIYIRTGGRSVLALTGVTSASPYLILFLAYFLATNAGVPPLPGFSGEILSLSALGLRSTYLLLLFVPGFVIAIAAMFKILAAAVGGASALTLPGAYDLSRTEQAILVLLIVLSMVGNVPFVLEFFASF